MSNDSSSQKPAPEVAQFFEAIGAGEADDLRTILKAHPGIASRCNAQGQSPILWALYNRRSELFGLLQQAGASVGPFEMCGLGQTENLQKALDEDPSLLASHADDGFTLLHLACFFGKEDIVIDLIARGADINSPAPGTEGICPLHAATAGGSITSTVKLLDAGAAPDVTQKGGFTALMSAAGQGNQSMANTLLRAGASPHLAAQDGRTAQDIAKTNGHKKLADFLGTK